VQQTGGNVVSPGFDALARAQIEGIVEHLNANHADTVLFVARHVDPAASHAELAAVDPAGAVLAVRRPEGPAERVRLDFPTVAADARDVQAHLVAAVGTARSAADSATPLTTLESELQVTASLRTVHGFVRRVQRLTPSLLEVTVAGVDDYPLAGGDEFVYVMVSPEPGGISPSYTMDDYREQVAGDQVHGAYYTVRRSRPDAGEVDLWVVEHDHPGSVAAWMRSVRLGAPIALWGPRRGFEIPARADDLLLVADETGLAAVAALVEVAAPGLPLVAVLETAGPEHRPQMPAHQQLRTVWVDRGDDAPGRVNRLLEAVRAEVAVAPGAAFGAAESRQVSAIRRHLRTSMAMTADVVSMTGYWRLQDGMGSIGE
jgi:NADPH-dependent ferric siderophore reductase